MKNADQALPSKGIGLPALVGLVTGVQALATFAVLAMPTLATKAAPAFGLGAEAAGYQISVIYLAAACLSSPSITRAVRTAGSQSAGNTWP